jgi:hypothetical protein
MIKRKKKRKNKFLAILKQNQQFFGLARFCSGLALFFSGFFGLVWFSSVFSVSDL